MPQGKALAVVVTVFVQLDRALSASKKTLATVLSVAVAVLMAIEVFTRYVMGEPLFGLEEITLMCVMWLYMIGAAMACRSRSHLKAELIQLLVRRQGGLRAIQVLTTLISLVMAVFITLWSFDLVIWGVEKQQSTPVFQIPWVVSQSSLFVGGVFFTLYFVRDLFVDIHAMIGKTDDPAEEPDAGSLER